MLRNFFPFCLDAFQEKWGRMTKIKVFSGTLVHLKYGFIKFLKGFQKYRGVWSRQFEQKEIFFFAEGFSKWSFSSKSLKHHTSQARDLKFWHNGHYPLWVTWNVTYFMCHMSGIRCQVSHLKALERWKGILGPKRFCDADNVKFPLFSR